jgi:O-antigen/teichoic acid export membrane protein
LTGAGYSIPDKIGIAIYGLTLFTQAILLSLNAITQKYLLSKKLIVPDLVSALVLIGIVVMGISQGRLIVVFIAYPISEVIGATLSLHVVNRTRKLALKTTDLRRFSKRIITLSFPLALMLFLNVIFFRADTLLLTFMKTSSDVGVYGVSYKIFELLIVFPTFFTASIYPLLIENRANMPQFIKYIKHYSLLLLGLSIIAAFLTIVLAPLLILLKPEYTLSVVPLQILAYSLPFFFLTSLFQWAYILKNKTMFLVVTYGISMIINIVLNFIFIPHYSYYASAFITVISEGIILFVMTGYFLFLSREKLLK